MELDELKYLWQNALDPEERQAAIEPAEIRRMLRSRSMSALGKINRNIWLETGLVIIFGLIGGWYVFSQPAPHELEIGLLGGYIVGSLIFYYFKYRSLNRKTLQEGNLRESLAYTVQSLGQFMRVYYYVFVPLIPLMSGVGMLYGFKEGAQSNGESLETIPLQVWGVLIVVMVIYMAIGYFATRWYVNRLYGRHYQELSICLDELMESELSD